MRASFHWIQEFIDLADAGDLPARLTMAGLEVEGREQIGAGNEGLVAAEVVSAEPVPGKNLLRCKVRDGKATHTVVCGDPTVKAGETVLYAPPGSKVKGRDMAGRKFGDIESAGMLCSLADTGLEARSDAVLRLDAPAGTPFHALVDLTDEVWELNVTPNRADALSQWGVAREFAAILGRPAHYPPLPVQPTGAPIQTAIRIEDQVACPLYTARVLRGVKIGPSPLDVRLRLERAGVRAINNVVDATNYVLMELGQPLHAFDLGKLTGGIVVRRAKSGEKLLTLDGVARELHADDLVIADEARALALAGVMGGADSEVTAATVDILLESAYFNPVVVRKGAKRHGLHSEASHRFERGVDPLAVQLAADRCAALICAWAGAVVEQGTAVAGAVPAARPPIALRPPRIAGWLGIAVPLPTVVDLLTHLGCTVTVEAVAAAGEQLSVVPPSWRQDLTIEADLIEEVARLYGYDRIPAANCATPLAGVPASPRTRTDEVRDWLRDAGFHETITYSFTAPEALAALGFTDRRARPIQLDKPLTTEQSVMRTSLAVSLLEAAGLNLRRGNQGIRLFDVSRVFLPAEPPAGAHSEPLYAGACAFGSWDDSIWGEKDRQADFFDLKGVLQGLLDTIGVEASWVPSNEPFLHPGMSADVMTQNGRVGWIGVLHPRVLRHFDLPRGVAFELDLGKLPVRKTRRIVVPSRYPSVMRDVAFLVERAVTSAEVATALREAGPDTLEAIGLFDVYVSEGLGTRKSLAYHLRFQAGDRTLTDEEIDKAIGAMVAAVKERLGGELRA